MRPIWRPSFKYPESGNWPNPPRGPMPFWPEED